MEQGDETTRSSKPATLMVTEMFYSLQGESTWSGLPCVFVRLMGCHLRCHYCDTEYAFHEGRRWTVDEMLAEVDRLGGGEVQSPSLDPLAPRPLGPSLVEITGGEPLLQPGVHELMARLCDAGKTVLIETSGACDISLCDPRVIRIMDLKTPGSGESHRMMWDNIDRLTPHDEVKFVLCSREDYEWARQVIRQYQLHEKVRSVLVSAAAAMAPGKEIAGVAGLSLTDLAQWVLEDHLPVRVQTQLHKLIWDPLARGV